MEQVNRVAWGQTRALPLTLPCSCGAPAGQGQRVGDDHPRLLAHGERTLGKNQLLVLYFLSTVSGLQTGGCGPQTVLQGPMWG